MSYIYRVAQKMYKLFTHQYLWNKSVPGSNISRLLPMAVPKGLCLSEETSYTGWSTENIAMSYAAITLDTLQNVVHAAVRRLPQCLDADGGQFEHLHWIKYSRTSIISILLLYKYSSYDYRVIFFISNCLYILLGHSVYGAPCEARNVNVVYIWTYVWQLWKPSFSIYCTMFQRWIKAQSFPVSQLCVNTLPTTTVTLITGRI
jgi:hypothetical protein